MKKILGIMIWLAGVLGTFYAFRLGSPKDPPDISFLIGLLVCALQASIITFFVRRWAVRKTLDRCTELIIAWGGSIASYVLLLFVVALVDGHLTELLTSFAVILLMGSILTIPMTIASIMSCWPTSWSRTRP